VSWAHPKFENVIATCGYDKRILLWKEVQQQKWQNIWEVEAASSVNSIAWAPWEYGPILAAGSADGHIHIISKKGDQWEHKKVLAHEGGVNSVSWGPSTEPSLLSKV
jgi:protein transport protein SEC13